MFLGRSKSFNFTPIAAFLCCTHTVALIVVTGKSLKNWQWTLTQENLLLAFLFLSSVGLMCLALAGAIVSAYNEETFLIEDVKTECVACKFVSMDGGKNWYAAEPDKFGAEKKEVKIIGPVEKIYPGFLDAAKARVELQQFAKEKGPDAFMNTRESLELRRRAGLFSASEEVMPDSHPTKGSHV